MRYSTEQRLRKYVKGHGFLSFSKKIGNKYGKKLMYTATKTGIDTANNSIKKSSSKNCRSCRRFNWK